MRALIIPIFHEFNGGMDGALDMIFFADRRT
jgi:hypothetical protein